MRHREKCCPPRAWFCMVLNSLQGSLEPGPCALGHPSWEEWQAHQSAPPGIQAVLLWLPTLLLTCFLALLRLWQAVTYSSTSVQMVQWLNPNWHNHRLPSAVPWLHETHWMILEETKSSPCWGSCLPQRPWQDARGSISPPDKTSSYTSSLNFGTSCSHSAPCYTPCCEMLCRETHGSGKGTPINSLAVHYWPIVFDLNRVSSYLCNSVMVQIDLPKLRHLRSIPWTELSGIATTTTEATASNTTRWQSHHSHGCWIACCRCTPCPLLFMSGKKSC